jgi:exodeoxyribonuclease VII large subunit
LASAIGAGESELSRLASALEALSPLAVLARGFSICRDNAGNPVRDSAALKKGDSVSLKFSSGSAKADITSVE